MDDFVGVDAEIPSPKGKKKALAPSPCAGAAAKSLRTYTCDVDGCGKLFARGEHLKRHIRSIHTYEKRESPLRAVVRARAHTNTLAAHRCPYPGCGKDFSRHDNLGQHMRVHKDYVPPKDKDAQKA
ncbi:hypothetical protein C0992_007004 [Termitomyces sp. T32_za158]|nr:hypothetical protein C0992_007004 [Termitomyces sp. T32_za158]